MAIATVVALFALIASVHLLVKIKTAGLGKLYEGLGWLIVVIAFAFNICCVARGVMHRHCHHNYCSHEMDCPARPGCMPGDANCTMKADGGHMCKGADSTGHCMMAMDSSGRCSMKADGGEQCKMKADGGEHCSKGVAPDKMKAEGSAKCCAHAAAKDSTKK